MQDGSCNLNYIYLGRRPPPQKKKLPSGWSRMQVLARHIERVETGNSKYKQKLEFKGQGLDR